MPAELSDALKKCLDDSPVFATMATVSRDGRPPLTVVWVKRDGDDLLISLTANRLQTKNIARNPHVTVMVNPHENPYAYAEIRGDATVTPDPGRELPDELALKYTGQDYATFNPAAKNEADRVVVRITPVKVVSLGL